MKKLLHEIIIIIVIVFAMYLISDSLDVKNNHIQNNTSKIKDKFFVSQNPDKKARNKNNKQDETFFETIKKSNKEKEIYKVYRKYNLIKPVNIKIDGKNVDINTCSADTFTKIKGIGPKIAEKIIEYRENKSFFKTPEDLINVKGIGQKKLEKILGK